MNAIAPLHVVYGSGQLGTTVVLRLLALGCRVRVVRRHHTAPRDVELWPGDAGDAEFAAKAAQGATALYHCVNPPYDAGTWEREIPRIHDSLIGAARASGARLVVMDNLYMYGRPNGKPLSEDSPIAPSSRKGEIRARAAERLLEAHRRGDARLAIARASDFWGPRATGSHFGDPFWPRALSSGVGQFVVRTDTPHTYHYLPDVGEGLIQLANADDDVLGRVWMLPAAPAVTTAELARMIGEALERPLKLQRIPPFVLRGLGAFVPMLRELNEMSYQWEEPFVVDDRRWRERFGAAAVVTALRDGIAPTIAWARQHYAD